MNDTILDVAGLSVSFELDDKRLLPVIDVSFHIGKSETLAIVGESGSGKSLTALSILGLLPRNAIRQVDRIVFDGKDLSRMSAQEMRVLRGDRITMIFQDPMTALDPCYRIGNQLTEVYLQHRDASRDDARARILEMFDLVRIDDAPRRFNQYPHELSGGLRQRVMIAMSLLCNPLLLIADEPTTALDVTVQHQILGLLKNIKDETGISLLMITHDLGVVAHVADRVAVMYCGQIVEQGPTRKILDTPEHPYTEGLLQCIPEIGRFSKNMKLGHIEGNVPKLYEMPGGCVFAPRCRYATKECYAAPIELVESDGRELRCIHPLKHQ